MVAAAASAAAVNANWESVRKMEDENEMKIKNVECR